MVTELDKFLNLLKIFTKCRNVKKTLCNNINDNLTYEQNCIIFKYVFDYIKCSKRFLIV